MKTFKKLNLLEWIRGEWIHDEVDLLDVEGVLYFQNKIFQLLLFVIPFIAGPLFIYDMFLYLSEGNYFAVSVDFFSLVILFLLITLKVIPEQTRKVLTVIIIYGFALIMLIETGGQRSGFVLILFSLMFSGFVLEKEISSRLILYNIFVFIFLTIGLFAGIFDDKAIALLKPTWGLNVLIVQACGIFAFLFMNTIVDGLIKQSNQIKEGNRKGIIRKRRYEEMIANIADVIVIVDRHGKVDYISSNVSEIYGWEDKEFLNHPVTDKIFSKDRDLAIRIFREFRNSQKKKMMMELRHPCKNGQIRNVEATLTNLLDDPVISGILINYHDITERKRIAEEITYMNYHDELTGLFNRAYFNKLQDLIDCQENLPISLISADIDGLKRINDSFGHLEGDRLIKMSAELLKNAFRKEDIIVRIGGDEFCIILLNTSSDDSNDLISRVNARCNDYNQENTNKAHYLSISLGVATKEHLNESIEETLKQADFQMYEVKNAKSKALNDQVIHSMKRVLFNKLPELEKKGHRCAELSQKIGKSIGLSKEELKNLELLSTLCDIGKIAVDDQIIKNPQNLTEKELKEYRRHCEIGHRIAKSTPEINCIAECILAHNEEWDGSGYPKGLSGEEIPLLSRIRYIASFYDHLERQKQEKVQTKSDKINELKKVAGTKFDPKLIQILIENL